LILKVKKKMEKEKDELFKLSREELEWFKSNYENLKKEYNNQWVVIKNKKIVGNGKTYEDIASTLKEQDKKTIMVEFIDSKRLAMFF